ncbi:NAD(P)H azoreductase [Poriferisphaera corsica]|uniref:NAD(P)H azoreductase n=1 Tax=Poriferisphaera corsica TaxID=2528020 RepID=A0A517YXQ5_9BACT|nr:ergot alkaloid biosynthesis protein [Poriferisphaera corsica]QDU34987.1 NAD(P)H azoreductase [Poriferisphaera corsica]
MGDILLTGGTGKIGRRLARQLSERGYSVRVASRSGVGVEGCGDHVKGIRFDWHDEGTFGEVIEGVDAAYLVGPEEVAEPLDLVGPFVERAVEEGVKRFVLVSASPIVKGGPMMGGVHAFLEKYVEEWAVLRPTWFMQNFSEQHYCQTIVEEGRIYSAMGDGKVGYIDVEDIAAVGCEALIGEAAMNRELILNGPKCLSLDEVAGLIGGAIGKRIEHVRLSEGEMAKRFEVLGMAEAYARVLAGMETDISHGSEDYLSREVEIVTGRKPRDFEAYVERTKEVWGEE